MLRKPLALGVALGLLVLASPALAQICDQTPPVVQSTSMPQNTGTIPPSGDLLIGASGNYLYALTQWGIARVGLTNNPGNPTGYSQVVVGKEGGASVGIIPIVCDCHQGSSYFDVAENSDGTGTARMIEDWIPYTQGGPPPPNDPNHNFSGLPAQATMVTGGGAPAYGQQIDLPDRVPPGGRVAVVATGSGPNANYFGYIPQSDAVYVANLTSPSGLPDYHNPMTTSVAAGWPSGQYPVRLKAEHVNVPGYDKYLLVGATSDLVLHVGEINTSSGVVTDVASGAVISAPQQIDIAVVNGEIFFFAAELYSGTQVLKYDPVSHVVSQAHLFSGTSQRVIVRGPQPFPALFIHSGSAAGSFIDVYDTKWLTEGGSPLHARSIPGFGSPDGAHYLNYGFEALVKQTNGSQLTAYLYRELAPPTLGAEALMRTDTFDISCIVADPNAPPVNSAAITNLTAQAQGRSTNYFGDKYSLADQSVSYAPLDTIKWDLNLPGGNVAGFAPDAAFSGAYGSHSNIPVAYLPCDPAQNGDPVSGNNCFASVGSPGSGSTFYFADQTHNANGDGVPPWVSPAISVLPPAISIVGYDGTRLQVLAGNPNNGDASASQGNTAEATFAWTFTPSGSASGTIVTVPTTATHFSLTVTYKGGYSVTKSGAVAQVDLVPSFTITPNPVLKGASLTLTNKMQKAAAATLNSVTYLLTPAGLAGTVPITFLPVNGTWPTTAPLTPGSYSLQLTYNYIDHTGLAQSAPVSLPLTVTDFTARPQPAPYTSQNHTGDVTFFPTAGFQMTQGHTYYLFDDECTPNPCASYPGVSFYKSTNGNATIDGDTLIGASTADGPVTFVASSLCASSCFFKAVVDGVVGVQPYQVASTQCVPPQCGGGGGASLTVTGSASTAAVGVPVTFTALPSGYTPTQFLWDFGDVATGTGGGGTGGGDGCGVVRVCVTTPAPKAAVAGPNPNTYSFTNPGTHTVTVTGSNGATTKSGTWSITITGTPAPSGNFSISGATLSGGRWQAPVGVPITFSAAETHATDWSWNFGDGSDPASGAVVTHTFTSVGSPNVTLTVTGDGTNTTGTGTGAASFNVFDPGVLAIGANGRFQVRVAWASTAQNTSGTGKAVTLTPDSGYFWFFNDTNLELVVKVLDACNVNGFHWVFAGGLTNLEVQLTVTDTLTGVTKTYDNSEGTAFRPIQDVQYEACTAGEVQNAQQKATTAPSVTLATPSPASPAVGDTVSFAATASGFTGSVSYSWYFGDETCFPGSAGCETTGPSDGTETHVYAAPGTYPVTVTASSGNQSAFTTFSLTVGGSSGPPPPSVAYSIPSGATRTSPSSPWIAAVNVPVTFTALETHAASYTWDFGDGSSDTGATVTHTYTTNSGNINVRLTVVGDGTATTGTATATIRLSVADPFTLHITNDRFAVSADWATGSGASAQSGHGTATSLTADTGYFWFFSSSNTEVIVKVLDACSIDGHYWLFASGLTNLGVNLTVTDTVSGTSHVYSNPDGTPFAPVQDFRTFACGNP